MDVRYRISVSGSTALLSPPITPDSKAVRLESDILATKAKGSCGVDPGQLRPVTLSALPKGDWLYDVKKRLVLAQSLMFSTFAMVRFTAWAVSL